MAVHTLDITKEHCPMTYVKAKLALSKIKGGEPLENVPRSAAEEGHEIVSTEQEGDYYVVSIKKA